MPARGASWTRATRAPTLAQGAPRALVPSVGAARGADAPVAKLGVLSTSGATSGAVSARGFGRDGDIPGDIPGDFPGDFLGDSLPESSAATGKRDLMVHSFGRSR